MKSIVLKIGGSELETIAHPGSHNAADDFVARLIDAVCELHQEYAVALVHGGGKTIANWQARLGLEPRFVDGLRVTDDASLDVAEMVEHIDLLKDKIDGLNVTDNQSSVMRISSLAICRMILDHGGEPILGSLGLAPEQELLEALPPGQPQRAGGIGVERRGEPARKMLREPLVPRSQEKGIRQFPEPFQGHGGRDPIRVSNPSRRRIFQQDRGIPPLRRLPVFHQLEGAAEGLEGLVGPSRAMEHVPP